MKLQSMEVDFFCLFIHIFYYFIYLHFFCYISILIFYVFLLYYFALPFTAFFVSPKKAEIYCLVDDSSYVTCFVLR